jgi:hypothetical protein
MRRLEYVCTACGRPFGRLESARRHVFNPNIHNGQGATITSLTQYALGIKQGRYLPPSYNVPGRILGGGKRSLLQQPPPPPSGNQRGQTTTKGTETMFDTMHKYANFARDLRDFNEIMTEQATKAAEMSRRNPLPEFLIGYACDRCYTTELRSISFLDPTMTLHQCDPARAHKFESVKNRDDETFKEVHKSFAGRIKLLVDMWTKNSGKYLIAHAITPEFAQQGPAWLKRFRLILQAGGNHYLNRAVTSAKKDGSWIAINDNETLDFVEKTHASVAIFEVKIDGNNNDDNNSKNEEDPASTHEYFLIRIVPPQYVEAKKQNDEIATLMKEFLKENDCKDLQ